MPCAMRKLIATIDLRPPGNRRKTNSESPNSVLRPRPEAQLPGIVRECRRQSSNAARSIAQQQDETSCHFFTPPRKRGIPLTARPTCCCARAISSSGPAISIAKPLAADTMRRPPCPEPAISIGWRSLQIEADGNPASLCNNRQAGPDQCRLVTLSADSPPANCRLENVAHRTAPGRVRPNKSTATAARRAVCRDRAALNQPRKVGAVETGGLRRSCCHPVRPL
jgi:hypothetical protein